MSPFSSVGSRDRQDDRILDFRFRRGVRDRQAWCQVSLKIISERFTAKHIYPSNTEKPAYKAEEEKCTNSSFSKKNSDLWFLCWLLRSKYAVFQTSANIKAINFEHAYARSIWPLLKHQDQHNRNKHLTDNYRSAYYNKIQLDDTVSSCHTGDIVLLINIPCRFHFAHFSGLKQKYLHGLNIKGYGIWKFQKKEIWEYFAWRSKWKFWRIRDANGRTRMVSSGC